MKPSKIILTTTSNQKATSAKLFCFTHSLPQEPVVGPRKKTILVCPNSAGIFAHDLKVQSETRKERYFQLCEQLMHKGYNVFLLVFSGQDKIVFPFSFEQAEKDVLAAEDHIRTNYGRIDNIFGFCAGPAFAINALHEQLTVPLVLYNSPYSIRWREEKVCAAFQERYPEVQLGDMSRAPLISEVLVKYNGPMLFLQSDISESYRQENMYEAYRLVANTRGDVDLIRFSGLDDIPGQFQNDHEYHNLIKTTIDFFEAY